MLRFRCRVDLLSHFVAHDLAQFGFQLQHLLLVFGAAVAAEGLKRRRQIARYARHLLIAHAPSPFRVPVGDAASTRSLAVGAADAAAGSTAQAHDTAAPAEAP